MNDQVDSKRKIGLLIPSSNTVMEPDFYRNAPPGWTVHTARMYMKDVTVEDESRMLDEYTLPAARDLATARPHVIVFGCTSAGALRGNDYDSDLVSRITDQTGIPTISVIKSVRQSLSTLGVKKLVVMTPYIDELNDRIRISLEADGLDIIKIIGMRIRENERIGRVEGSQIIDFCRKNVSDLLPDALFVSCTNFPAMDVLDRLQQMYSFPVITSNKAALDAAIITARNLP